MTQLVQAAEEQKAVATGAGSMDQHLPDPGGPCLGLLCPVGRPGVCPPPPSCEACCSLFYYTFQRAGWKLRPAYLTMSFSILVFLSKHEFIFSPEAEALFPGT